MRHLPLLTSLALWGCASTLSSFQTAQTIGRGHVQVTAGTGLYVPLGPPARIAAQGVKQAADAAGQGSGYALSEADQQELLSAGIALAVFPPSQQYEVAVRTGILDDLDVGLRYSLSAWRLDTKYRFFHRGDDVLASARSGPPIHRRKSFDMAMGLGVSRYSFDHPAVEVLDFLQLANFSRWDIEVPLYASADLGDIFKVYVGPKYLYSRTGFDGRLMRASVVAQDLSGQPLQLPAVVNAHFVGSSAGIALGYRYVHLLVELTGGYTFCEPALFGMRRNLGGPTLYPAVGLNVKL